MARDGQIRFFGALKELSKNRRTRICPSRANFLRWKFLFFQATQALILPIRRLVTYYRSCVLTCYPWCCSVISTSRERNDPKTMLFRPSLRPALTPKTCVIRITQVLCSILPLLFLHSTKHINVSSPSICTIFHTIQWTISLVPTEIQNCNLAFSPFEGEIL